MDDRQQIETQHGQDRAHLDWVATQPVPIPGLGLALQLGADTVTARDQVRLLGVTIILTVMCPLSVRRPSIHYVSFDDYVVHSTLSRQRRLSMLL